MHGTNSFNGEVWFEAMAVEGLDPTLYDATTHKRGNLSMDHIDCGVSKSFFWSEGKHSAPELTAECRTACHACGAQQFKCGICPTAPTQTKSEQPQSNDFKSVIVVNKEEPPMSDPNAYKSGKFVFVFY